MGTTYHVPGSSAIFSAGLRHELALDPVNFAHVLTEKCCAMNVLLFHPDADTLEMLSFCLETEVGLNVHRATSFQEAMDFFLDDASVDLVVTSQQPETDKLFKYILSTSAQVPVILIDEGTEAGLDTYPDIRFLGKVRRADVPDKLVQLVRDQARLNPATDPIEDYCRIKANLLLRVVPLRGDIFIRLSSVKFVKLFRTGMKFTSEDLDRTLHRKKIQFLYIKKCLSGCLRIA
jgi:hypothetical protein